MDSHRHPNLLPVAYDVGVTLKIDPTRPHDFPDFKWVKKIGAGNFGEVLLYKYTGTDKRILGLCDEHGQIILKKPKEGSDIDFNELNNSALLFQYAAKADKIKDVQFSLAVPLFEPHGEPIGLLSQFISHDDYCESSADIEGFIKNLANITSVDNQNSDDISIAIIISKLITATFLALRSVHEAGFLHRDLATRNVLVDKIQYDPEGNPIWYPVKIIDFGLSAKIPDSGIAQYTHSEGAIRWIDLLTLSTRDSTVKMDLFAFVASMIEKMAYALGAQDCNNILCITPPDEDINVTAKKKISPGMTDALVLSLHFQHLYQFAHKCKDSRKDEIILLIDAYKEVVVNMSDSINVNESDKALYGAILKANDNFVQKYFEYRLDKLKAIKAALDKEMASKSSQEDGSKNIISEITNFSQLVKELLHHHFSEEFKASKEYTRIAACIDPVGVSKEIKEGEEHTRTTSRSKRHMRINQTATLKKRESLTQALSNSKDQKRESRKSQQAPLPPVSPGPQDSSSSVSSTIQAPLPPISHAPVQVSVPKLNLQQAKSKGNNDKKPRKRTASSSSSAASTMPVPSAAISATEDAPKEGKKQTFKRRVSQFLGLYKDPDKSESSGQSSPRKTATATTDKLISELQNNSLFKKSENLPAVQDQDTAYSTLPNPPDASSSTADKDDAERPSNG